ncbi:transglycosylase SLT domain-containing protein [Hahella ganghwensis]|uniref:transglycosylase SLT domain-containing protein n=1 Tax=Hahella ganghwensis TaxID=286420 RepID=UPI00036F8F73|nr:transglycosylase SLT domain-containing protein [Hahella ganghwensis]
MSFNRRKLNRSRQIVVADGVDTPLLSRLDLTDSQVCLIGKDDLCDISETKAGLSDKHCIVNYSQGHVWVKSMAEAYLEGNLLPVDKSCLWRIGQRLTVGNMQLILQVPVSHWEKITNTASRYFDVLNFYRQAERRWLVLVAIILLVVTTLYSWLSATKESLDALVLSEQVSTLDDQLIPGDQSGAHMLKVAKDVAEVFRLSGMPVSTSVAAPGEILVRGDFADQAGLRKVIYSSSMREVSGLSKILVESYQALGKQPDNSPYSYIDYIVEGLDNYIVANDGSRFYLGSVLPGGERLVGLEQESIVVEHLGVSAEIPKQQFTVVKSSQPNQLAGATNNTAEPGDYAAYIQEAVRLYEVPESIIRAVIQVESGYDPQAISHAGAIGLMQLMPDTANSLGVQNPFDPQQNILGGSKHLKDLLGRYDNNLTLALAAYNAGEGAVNRYRGVPPYSETQDYVAKVQRLVGFYDQEKDPSLSN